MHPILVRRQRLAAYLAGWTLAGAVLAAAPWLAGESGLGSALAFVVPLALIYGFVCLAVWYPCRATPLASSSLARLAATHLSAAFLTSGLWCGAAILVARLAWHSEVRGTTYLFSAGVLLYLLAVAVHYLLIALEASRLAERRVLQAEVAAREAELRALRAQVNPHFLFNSLNSIGSLAGSDPLAARRMCLLLGDFLRQSLRLGGRDRIPLADELALVANYLEIERVRFGARLQVEEDVEESARACSVPPLVLQPLVENAVVHGVAQRLEGGAVRCVARREGALLRIALENPCDADRPLGRGAGVGLDNVRRRLAATYGDQARLETSEAGGRFRAVVTLPAENAPATQLEVAW
jgi:two-component system sensor histidine kinase AlgZ